MITVNINTYKLFNFKMLQAIDGYKCWFLSWWQKVAKHLRGTLTKSSAVISTLVGPVQQMSLANHPVKGLYFTLAGGPEVP